MDSYLAILLALLCRDGVGRMRADAEAALAGLSPASPWRAGAMVFKGAAELLDGWADRADATLAHAVEVGRHAAALPAVSTALAERCLLAIQGDDWGRAEAREHLARAARVRPLLTYAVPWGAVQSLPELGRCWLALDDVAGARAVLLQARDVLRLRPGLGVLPAQAEELGSRLEVARGALPGPSSLSTAELRLLPLLSTHLSFREIGERLYISQHTVKTQAMSVYRKLGASSRSQAVQRLQEIGLLGA